MDQPASIYYCCVFTPPSYKFYLHVHINNTLILSGINQSLKMSPEHKFNRADLERLPVIFFSVLQVLPCLTGSENSILFNALIGLGVVAGILVIVFAVVVSYTRYRRQKPKERYVIPIHLDL